MVNERLNSFWAKRTSDAFFKSGEFVVDKSIEFLAKTKTNAHLSNGKYHWRVFNAWA